MAKKNKTSHIEEAQVVSETIAHPVLTTSSTEAEIELYKAHHNIPPHALLAWRKNQLPKYFRQNNSVFFRDWLAVHGENQFDTPIWFELIGNPHEVEILESLFIARCAAQKFNIAN